MTQTRTEYYTFTDFLELVQEDQKADLIDGVIYMASPENMDHNDLVLWLAGILRAFAEERKLGRVTINKVAFRLGRQAAPEPDVAFVAAERVGLIRRGYVDGPPDLAIEIVSPDSVQRDYELKRRVYDQAGVREYWIIDPDEKRAMFLLRRDAAFVEVQPTGHVFQSEVLPGFNLDVRWLWERPLPAVLATIQRTLGTSRQ